MSRSSNNISHIKNI